jgi:hypothetical protein
MARLRAYIGPNWDTHYEKQFQRLVTTQRTGEGAGWMWNWPAALTPLWFLYRRLYGAFFLYAALHLLLGAFGMTIPLAIVQGCRGDLLLFRKAREEVHRAGDNVDPAWLARRGQPQEWVAWLPLAPLAAMVIVGMVFLFLPGRDPDANNVSRLAAEQNAPAPVAGPLMAQNPKAVLSRDGSTQITVPGTWNLLPTPNALLQIKVGNTAADQTVATLTDARSGVSADVDLEMYARLSAEELLNRMPPGTTVSEPIRMTINGNPAIQYELTDRTAPPVVAWMTAVETRQNYHRVMATTGLDEVDENRPLLQEVIHTFRETFPQPPVPPE